MRFLLTLLLEDSIAHVRALEQVPLFKHVLRDATADNETLAYLRRIKLIRNMLDCLKEGGGPEMAALVRSTEEKLSVAQSALVDIVTTTMATQEQVTQNTFDTKSKVVASQHAACQALVKSLQ